MLKTCLVFLAATAIACSFALAQNPKPEELRSAVDETISPLESGAADAIDRSSARYTAAFNRGDAGTIAELYAESAELIDAAGNVFRGREAIRREYAAFFQFHPNATIRIELDEVRVLSTSVAMEYGRTETKLKDSQPAVFSRYTAIHGKVGESWKLMSVTDTEADLADPGANLEQLSWLIGKWVDEDRDSLVEIDCYWNASGSFLIREFTLRFQGLLEASGTERIGWDPLRKEIRSWVFDSQGGYNEASWKRTSDGWMVAAKGYRADGEPTQAVYILTPIKKDAYHLASLQRFAGKLRLDDLDMTIVRSLPPSASKEHVAPDSPNESENTEK